MWLWCLVKALKLCQDHRTKAVLFMQIQKLQSHWKSHQQFNPQRWSEALHQYETENPKAKLGGVPNPTEGRDPGLARAWLNVLRSLAACSSCSQGTVIRAKGSKSWAKAAPTPGAQNSSELSNVPLQGWLSCRHIFPRVTHLEHILPKGDNSCREESP